MSSPNDDDQNEVSRQSSTRRPRAPTITIDTSAVSPTRADDESEERAEATQGDATHDSENSQRSGPPVVGENSQSSELRPAPSFDSQSSRPTSPHNVSSPTSRNGQQHNFLSVPNPRSRGSSVDSGEPAQSPTSYGGDTYIPSPGSSQHTEARNVDTSQSSDHLLPDDEALKPDPGTEGDFERDNNPFAFTPGQVNKMLNPKSLGAFHALGGLQGLARGLKTSVGSGLSVDERNVSGKITFEEAVVSPPESKEEGPKEPGIKRRSTTIPLPKSEDVYLDRRRIFSDNRLPEKKAKSIWELAWLAYNDKVLILLSVAAVVSLALGIYQSVSAHNGETVQWVEGVAIIVAIVIVVVVGAANDWQKERQFVKLNRKKEDRLVKVVRSGKSREVNVHDIFTGDVMHLEPGDMIPVDGIFISGHNVTCDESSATGESDLLKKTPGDVAFRAIESHESLNKIDPFILSGAKVTEGVGTFLVTSTGVNSSHGKTMMSLQEESQTTPLQSKLNMLAEYIAKIGLTAGLLLFIATFIKFLVRLPKIEGGPNIKGQEFLAVFIVAVTIVVVSVPEGLPLAVTLALAFATTRMLKDNNLVRHLRACETMGNATTICSDKTGTLTQNKMSVVAGTIGTQARFGSTSSITDDAETSPGTPNEPKEVGLPSETSEVAIPQVIKTLSEDVKEVLKESIAINSTAFEGEVNGEESFIGSKTETALLTFARERLGMDSLRAEREAFEVVQQIPFDSGRKCMATAVKRSSGRYRIYVKGASELMVSRCAKIIQDPSQGITEAELNEDDIESLDRSIESFAGRSLRTIGILFKDYEQWPPRGIPTLKGDPTLADFDQGFKDLTFLAIVGIQDPLRDGVATAVQECQKAGVVVRMVTGDNLMTAKAIARDCGIFTPGGIVMEGPQFRKLSKTQMNQIIPRLQVLARSSPDDKRTLVKRLKDLGETVAVTGKVLIQKVPS